MDILKWINTLAYHTIFLLMPRKYYLHNKKIYTPSNIETSNLKSLHISLHVIIQ